MRQILAVLAILLAVPAFAGEAPNRELQAIFAGFASSGADPAQVKQVTDAIQLSPTLTHDLNAAAAGQILKGFRLSPKPSGETSTQQAWVKGGTIFMTA